MKKQSSKIFAAWGLVVCAVAGGTFLFVEHLNSGVRDDGTAANQSAVSGADIQPDDTDAVNGATAPSVPMQRFSDAGAGYAFSVPTSWNIEQTAADAVALHPNASSSDAMCKIEMSAFPYSPDTDMGDWIAHRIGADPSIAVVEQSSEAVSITGAIDGTGVQWNGLIDGVSTTLVYAFSTTHAYEIAPSIIGDQAETAVGAAQCNDMLASFISTLTI